MMKQAREPIQIGQPAKRSPLYSLVALPWCCIIPVAFSWLGVGSAALGIFLRPLTFPLLAISIALLGYSNYRVWRFKWHRTRAHIFWMAASMIISATLWGWSLFVMRALF